jgi:glycosyltransferase involved in cell wall biosynthesis
MRVFLGWLLTRLRRSLYNAPPPLASVLHRAWRSARSRSSLLSSVAYERVQPLNAGAAALLERQASPRSATPQTAGTTATGDLSVVIPFVNEAGLINVAVDSVRSQSADAQIILVGDRPDNASLAAALSLMDHGAVDAVICHHQRCGLAAARNTGLVSADRSYVTFLDADDFLIAGTLADRMAAVKSGDLFIAGAYSDWRPVAHNATMDSVSRGTARKLPPVDFISSLGDTPFIASAPIIRRPVADSLGGFDESMLSAEDADFWTRLFRAGYSLNYSEVTGVAYRQRAGGMVHSRPIEHFDYWSRAYEAAHQRIKSSVLFPEPANFYAARWPLLRRLVYTAALALFSGQEEEAGHLLGRLSEADAWILTRDVELRETAHSARARIAHGGTQVDISTEDEFLEAVRDALGVRARPASPQNSHQLDVAEQRSRYGRIYDSEKKVRGVALIPLAGYHVDGLEPVARELQRMGHAVTWIITSAFSADVVSRILSAGDRPARLVYSTGRGLDWDATSALVSMNDWSPIVRRLFEAARAAGIPCISHVEGVQDFLDVDTGRARRAYRRSDLVLAQGENDMIALQGVRSVVAGSPRIEALVRAPSTRAALDLPLVVINSNFTFGVLESARDEWLRMAVSASLRAGTEPRISQHYADRALPDDVASYASQESALDMLKAGAAALVTRFSTLIYEACALGVPVVYAPPPNEHVRPLGAPYPFPVCGREDELLEAIKNATATASFAADARPFLERQVSLEPVPAEIRMARIIAAEISTPRLYSTSSRGGDDPPVLKPL